jgi:VCBS repeat-containing protein
MAKFPAVLDLATTLADGRSGFRIDGAAVGDSLGSWLATAGDINGDGYADVIVAATDADGLNGAAFVLLGHAGAFSPINVSNLPAASGFKLTPFQAHNVDGFPVAQVGFAKTVASAGDFNGDGRDDIALGSLAGPFTTNFASGSVSVIFGNAVTPQVPVNVTSLSGTVGTTLTNPEYGDDAAHVGSAGDVNGDGIDDIVIGAPGMNDAQGGAIVVFGRKGGMLSNIDLSKLNGSDGFLIEPNLRDGTGETISAAGDINGDGIDDIVVSAREFSDWSKVDPNDIEGTFGNAKLSVGAAYVVFGHKGTWSPTLDPAKLDGKTGFRIEGAKNFDNMGAFVNHAGDVNGDGLDDLVIGSPTINGITGASYVVFGRKGGFGAVLNVGSLDGKTGFRIDGAAKYDGSGYQASSAGDVNGDGFDDLIVANGTTTDLTGSDAVYKGTTAAYVVFGHGGTFSPSMSLSKLDGGNGFKIRDSSVVGSQPMTVSAAGDMNKDGFDDILVGLPAAGAGRAYVVFGHATNAAPTALKLSASTVRENAKAGTAVGSLLVTDPDKADTFTFKLTDDAGGRFALSGSKLVVKNGALLDYEKVKSDTVTVQVSDNAGASLTKTLTIAITDVNDAPVITPPKKAPVVAENTKFVATLTATDADSKSLTWSVDAKDKDGKLFSITQDGKLSFVPAPDFEAPKDAGKNNIYDVTVKVSDGKLTDTQALSIKVTDVKGKAFTGKGKADTLKGTLEADTLTGNGGADKLTGGGGNDLFVFAKLSDSTVDKKGRDTIFDFAKGDRFDLRGIDADTGKAKDQAFTWIGDKGFSGKAGELRFEKLKSDTYVYAEVDGKKGIDFAFHLDDAVTLQKADFLL